MSKGTLILCLAAALQAGGVWAQGGFLNALKDKVTGGAPEPEVQQTPMAAMEATPAPAEKNAKGSEKSTKSKKSGKPNVKVVEGTPPPNAQPQATPDKATIREGARKLAGQMNVEKIPGDLFRKYAGKWKGEFWVYTPSGKLEESKSATLEFTPSGNSMKMESFMFDRISKSWVTAETATYSNDGDKVRVNIQRPNASKAAQTGYFNDGQLFLTANINDGVEHYRERVDGRRLLIDGFGVYSGKTADSHVFIGRFLKE